MTRDNPSLELEQNGEITEVAYLENEHPECEYGIASYPLDETFAQVLIDAARYIEEHENGVGDSLSLQRVWIGGQCGDVYTVSVEFEGSLDEHLGDPMWFEFGGIGKSEVDLRSVSGSGTIRLGVELTTDSDRCEHPELRYIDANSSECIECGATLSNTEVSPHGR